MTPFQEIKKVPRVRAIGMGGDMSLWDVDTAFTRLYDKAMEGRLMFRQPALGVRHGGLRVPDAFRSDYHVLFPLNQDPVREVPGTEIVELPEAEVASFIHRGPYEWIQCTYEKVLDWLRENRYPLGALPLPSKWVVRISTPLRLDPLDPTTRATSCCSRGSPRICAARSRCWWTRACARANPCVLSTRAQGSRRTRAQSSRRERHGG